MTKPVGVYKPIYRWFNGYDEANYTTLPPHGKELLGELHDLSPVPVYIRTHHLLILGRRQGAELKFSSTNVYSGRRKRANRSMTLRFSTASPTRIRRPGSGPWSSLGFCLGPWLQTFRTGMSRTRFTFHNRRSPVRATIRRRTMPDGRSCARRHRPPGRAIRQE